jgi:hypothetical protein
MMNFSHDQYRLSNFQICLMTLPRLKDSIVNLEMALHLLDFGTRQTMRRHDGAGTSGLKLALMSGNINIHGMPRVTHANQGSSTGMRRLSAV